MGFVISQEDKDYFVREILNDSEIPFEERDLFAGMVYRFGDEDLKDIANMVEHVENNPEDIEKFVDLLMQKFNIKGYDDDDI